MLSLRNGAAATVLALGIMACAAGANAAAPFQMQGFGNRIASDFGLNTNERQLHHEMAWFDSARSNAYRVATVVSRNGGVEGKAFSLVGLSILPQTQRTLHG